MRYIITESQYKLVLEDGIKIKPSYSAIKNICDSERFCSAQGKITFGQLKAIVESATQKRLFKHVGEGGYKATLRLLPWFLPQLALAGFISSSVRALNKIFRPTLTETTSYKTWWGKTVMRMFDFAEGELNTEDPLSRIFFISDGLMTLMSDTYKIKFAHYISNLAESKPDDEEVPEYFVENELRKWINDKFILNPPLPPKISKTQELDLGDQDSITESQYSRLSEDKEKVLKIPSLKVFGDWETLQEFLKSKGNPPYSVGGNLYLDTTRIKTLGNLQSVGGSLDLDETLIETLGNLQSVGKSFYLRNTSIESLENLKSVGLDFYLSGSSIESLSNLQSVGGSLDLRNTPMSEMYNETQIRNMVYVGGNIYNI